MVKIIETIKALLAKAASTEFDAEAEAFLAKAHYLMEKHQLDAEDLERDDPVGHEETYDRADRGGVDWDFTLMFGVAYYFGCKAIRIEPDMRNRRYRIGLVGRESARVTATEMHKYLIKTIRRMARDRVGTREFRLFKEFNGKHYWTGSYLNADQIARLLGNAMNERLHQLAYEAEPKTDAPTASGKNALITLDRVAALYQEKYPKAVAIRGAGGYSTGSARELAAQINLSHQVGGSDGARLLG